MTQPSVWEKMDAHIDTIPQIVRCGEDARAAREVYLFVLRRNRLTGARGGVPVECVDTWYLARMLFMPEPEARAGLVAAIRVGLLKFVRDGQALQLDDHALQRVVTDRNALHGPDFVAIDGWNDAWGALPPTGAERQKLYRERKKARESIESDTNALQRDVTDCNALQRVTTRCESDTIDKSREDRDLDLVSIVAESSATAQIKTKADRIPDRAWGAADALRAMVIACNPSANIAVKPWDGQKRPPNVVERIEPNRRRPPGVIETPSLEKRGNRLKWAEELRKLAEIDGRSYEEIWAAIKWLQYKQPTLPGTGFVVESPKSLREKWGNIARHMAAPDRQQQRSSDDVDSAVAQIASTLAGQAVTP